MAEKTETFTVAEWRAWAHENVDVYLRTLTIDKRDFLAILDQLDEAREHAAALRRGWDEERERL